MIREGERGELAVHCIAKVVGHALRRRLGPLALKKSERAFGKRQTQKPKDRPEEELSVLAANACINNPANELWNQ